MRLTKRNLYDKDVYDDVVKRIQTLSPDDTPAWGKMDAGQMLAHCAEAQDVINGKNLKGTPFFVKLFSGLIRNTVVNEKPYRKDTPTHPQYKQLASVDFEQEKKRLLDALATFYSMDKAEAEKLEHPLFGTMSLEERGWASFKHLDHHLKQFNV